jgi:hypothetical protein
MGMRCLPSERAGRAFLDGVEAKRDAFGRPSWRTDMAKAVQNITLSRSRDIPSTSRCSASRCAPGQGRRLDRATGREHRAAHLAAEARGGSPSLVGGEACRPFQVVSIAAQRTRWAEAKMALYGHPDAMANLIRRTLMVTRAPILNSLRRIWVTLCRHRGGSSNHAKVVLAKQLSLIRRPDALF